MATGGELSASLSGDGRFVAFASDSREPRRGRHERVQDIFVHDRRAARRARQRRAAERRRTDRASCLDLRRRPLRRLQRVASNLVAGDTNGTGDVFVRDRQIGTTSASASTAPEHRGTATARRPRSAPTAASSRSTRSPRTSSAGTRTASGRLRPRPPDRRTTGRQRRRGRAGERRQRRPCDLRRRPLRGVPAGASNLVAGDTNGSATSSSATARAATTSASASGNRRAGERHQLRGRARRDGRYRRVRERRHEPRRGRHERALRRLRPRPPERHDRARERRLGRGAGERRQRRRRRSRRRPLRGVRSSDATNLVAGDTNGALDVFVRDRQTRHDRARERRHGGAQGNGGSQNPSISADGRFVAFRSTATNLVAGDTNGLRGRLRPRPPDRHDRARQRRTGGAQGNDGSSSPAISRRRPLRGVRLSRHEPRRGRHERELRRLRARPPDAARPSA